MEGLATYALATDAVMLTLIVASYGLVRPPGAPGRVPREWQTR
jgi:hypothetical protein